MKWSRSNHLLSLDALVCKRDERALFEPLSLEVQPGDCVELLGPNGAGKTTLLRTLAGLHSQLEGAFNCPDFLYQGHRMGLDELLTPLENLSWHAGLLGTSVDHEILKQVLMRVDMVRFALTPCQQLSQGQQRRVGMARWLLSTAQVWLLDEPYTSLDAAGQDLLNEILSAHCDAGGVVLAATHVGLQLELKEGRQRKLQIVPNVGEQGASVSEQRPSVSEQRIGG